MWLRTTGLSTFIAMRIACFGNSLRQRELYWKNVIFMSPKTFPHSARWGSRILNHTILVIICESFLLKYASRI